MAVRVSPKYQVVIPLAVRESLNIRAGMELEVIAKNGVAYLVPVPQLKSLQARLQGKLDRKNIREKKDRKL